MSHNCTMRVAYRDLVPIARLFSTQLPISEGHWRHLANFIQGSNISFDLHSDHENFKGWKEAPPPRTIIAWQRAVGSIVPTRNLPTVMFKQFILLWGSFAPRLGLMAATYVLTIFRTRKHLGSVHGACLETSYGHEDSEAE